MGIRPLAATAAFSTTVLAAVGGLTPQLAYADSTTPTTYYVAGSSSCSDTGAGTQAAPFCTIRHAATVATVPGDTVLIAPGSYAGEIDITASGTAAAPITYAVQGGPASAFGAVVTGNTPYALHISEASYINVSGLRLNAQTTNEAEVEYSSHITLDHIWASGPASANEAVFLVQDGSTNVTLSRDVADANGTNAIGIEIESYGAQNGVSPDDVVASDFVDGYNSAQGIVLYGSPGAAVTGNTVTRYCGSGISLGSNSYGSSSNATVENNVVFQAALPSSPTVNGCLLGTNSVQGLAVQTPGDGTGTTLADNTVFPGSNTYPWSFMWEGTSYDTAASFANAVPSESTGAFSGNPGLNADGTAVNESSEIIDSANSDAPGETATDLYYTPRFDDPNVPDSGGGSKNGYDRGAFQYAETLTAGALTYPVSSAPVGTPITFTAPTVTSNWANAVISYTYDFGDGSTPVTTTSSTYAYAFKAAGNHTVTITATSGFGASASVASFPVTISAGVAFTVNAVPTAVNALGVSVKPVITTPWTVTTESVDFGDGSAASDLLHGGSTAHTYAVPGTYTVTTTVADNGGNSKKVTTGFTTAGSDFVPFGPARLLDTRSGLGGSTSAQLGNNGSIKLKVAGVDGIPTGISAVDLNLTEVGANGNGYIRATAGPSAAANTSNLNYFGPAIYSNGAIVPVAADGTVTLANNSTRTTTVPNLIADVSGYFIANAKGSEYVAAGPLRIMDTRSGLGGSTGRLTGGQTDVLTVAGAPNTSIPATGVTAVSVDLTEVATTGSGYLTAYPDGGNRPGTSVIDWQGGTTHAAGAIIPVAADGKVDIYNGGTGTSSADVLVDVTGYFTQTPGATDTVYVPVTPDRILDTRNTGSLGLGLTQHLNLSGVDGTPAANGTAAPSYVFNSTVTNTEASGYLSAGGNPATLSQTSMLNWLGSGQTVANLSFLNANAGSSSIDLYYYYGGSSSVPVHVDVLADLMGYFSSY